MMNVGIDTIEKCYFETKITQISKVLQELLKKSNRGQ